MPVFQQKYYNAEAWGAYMDYLVRIKPTHLIASGAVSANPRVAQALASQTGTLTATMPYYSDGTEDTTTQDYDGVTDLVAVVPPTYSQTFGSTGRMKAWYETDFSIDLTTADSVNAVYARLANWRRFVVEQPLALSILKGLFAVNANQADKSDFIQAHSAAVTEITADSLNTALEEAAGDYKDGLTLFICHSRIATQLENLQLVDYVKYTTPEGIETDTTLKFWNGRLLLVDNQVNDGAASGSFIGYALGAGALTLQDLSVKVPIETDRDPFKAGGQETLIARNRYAFGAKGFSFVPTAGATKYGNAQIASGNMWALIHDAEGNTIPHKEIPIARVVYTPTPAIPEPVIPVITIGTQPADASVTVGSITEKLSVTATATESATIVYQWYSNTTKSNTGGTSLGAVGGAQTAELTIPTDLTAGTYYYYCVLSASGAVTVKSKVATVTAAGAGE